jgi:hypothetical protein
MSTLLVQRLDTELAQEIRYTSPKRCSVAAFIPYLYLHNAPSGTFTFELLNSDDDIIFSQQFDSADIKASIPTTDNYAHVFYPVVPNNPIQIESGLYTIKLSASGYSPSSTSYLGWIQQFENLQLEMDYVPENDSENPLSIRIKQYE